MTFVSFQTKILVFAQVSILAYIVYIMINKSSVADYQLKYYSSITLLTVFVFLYTLQQQIDKIRSNPNVNQM